MCWTSGSTVADGETVALVGRNGAGKTTVLEALAGLVPLEAGRIELDDRRIDGLDVEQRGIGLAFQDGALFPRMSVRENVAFAARARGDRRRSGSGTRGSPARPARSDGGSRRAAGAAFGRRATAGGARPHPGQ